MVVAVAAVIYRMVFWRYFVGLIFFEEGGTGVPLLFWTGMVQ